MTNRDPEPNLEVESDKWGDPLPDDGRIEPITAEDIEDAMQAFDDAFPDLTGLLDAEPE